MTKTKINSYVALKCTLLYALTLCAELTLYSGIFHVGLEPVFQRKYDLPRYNEELTKIIRKILHCF